MFVEMDFPWLNRRAPEGSNGTKAPGMSSKDVNRALRGVVWPALEQRGFKRRTARTAWRDGADQIDVVNFQSFNSYNAGVLGVTTFSFAVNLGVFARCRPTGQINERDGALWPAEYDCDFRHRLKRRVRQSHDHADIWSVAADGSNLDSVVEDARKVLLEEGLAWFDQLSCLDAMYAMASEAAEDMSATWGMGNIGSPHRRELLADLARALRTQQRD
jgi:hypothetical protein